MFAYTSRQKTGGMLSLKSLAQTSSHSLLQEALMVAASRECSAEEVLSNPGDPVALFTPGLTLGPDPLQLALAFLVTGEANKQKVWNELVSSGKASQAICQVNR